MTKPSEFSTADYKCQTVNEKSELEVLWKNIMDRGAWRGSTTYTDAEVLVLCWTDNSDGLTTKEEVSRLSATFEQEFNFHTHIKYLDTAHKRSLQVQVNTIVANFVGAHDGPRTLLIVYYAGHAKPGISSYGSLELFGFVELALCSTSLLIFAGKFHMKGIKR